jgi:myxalamid-type polyketide synthase MxaD
MTPSAELSPLKQAYLAIERLQSELDRRDRERNEPIAIIGMGCRFPGGSASPEAFWEMLREGRDGITEVPPDRWDSSELYHPDPQRPGRISTRWGGFIDSVDEFDARFFGINPREAEQMDPQQRLLLEVAFEALEAGGQPTSRLAGSRTGVYVGLIGVEYGLLQMADIRGLDAYSGTGTSYSIASGRLAYQFGFHGPAVTIDTACSSSLATIHMACEALRRGECDLALAGGVSVMLTPISLLSMSRMGVLSPDGRCRTLDRDAKGFAPGEGCGLVVLKRLSDAQADGDPILALIRGSAVNQDGRTNVLSAPNGRAQAEVVRRALDAAGVNPSDITFLELHGTATTYGDPIEIDALRDVFGPRSRGSPPCLLGAVKTNIGHTGAASGVAGVIKTVLALRHRLVPPNLHFVELNPHIRMDDSPFVIPVRTVAWDAEAPRLAGVSAFGWSGTNVHLVLSEAPVREPTPAAANRPIHVLPISAGDDRALEGLVAAVRGRLDDGAGAPPIGDIAYTAGARRSHHAHRISAVGCDRAELAAGIAGALAARPAAERRSDGERPKLVYVFSPHGSQWAGMGRRLLEHEPVFRSAIERCEAALAPYVDWSLTGLIGDADASWLERIDRLQPVLFALQVALSEQWRAWGVEPDAIVGHSMGEVAASHVAGALSLDEAARVIVRRTRLLHGLGAGGAMGIVELPRRDAEKAAARYAGRLSFAASNSPRFSIISGETAALESLLDELQAAGVFCGWGVADVASHTPQVAALEPELRRELGTLSPAAPTVPLYSTVRGGPGGKGDWGTDYWVTHLCRPVLFSDVVQRLAADGHDVFLEIGPGPVLGPAIDEGLAFAGVDGVTLPTLQRDVDDHRSMLETLGRLYTLGCDVRWDAVSGPGECVPWPAYPWQRERFWLRADTAALLAGPGSRPSRTTSVPAVLGERLEVAEDGGREIYALRFDSRERPAPFHHRLFGAPVLPGSAALELAFAAADLRDDAVQLADVAFRRALVLSDTPPWSEAQLVVERSAGGTDAFRLLSRSDDGWRCHVTGRIVPAEAAARHRRASPDGIREALPQGLPGPEAYRRLEASGVEYGPDLRVVGHVWWGPDQGLARLDWPGSSPSRIAVLDAGLQVLAWCALRPDEPEHDALVPVGVGRARWLDPDATPRWAHVVLEAAVTDVVRGRAALLDERGDTVFLLDDVEFAPVGGPSDELSDWLYEIEWRRAPAGPWGPRRPRRWLVLTDAGGLGDELCRVLTSAGDSATTIGPGTGFGKVDRDAWRVRSGSAADFQAVVDEVVAAGNGEALGVISLWSLDGPALGAGIGSLLHMVRSIKERIPDRVCPFYLATRGAQPVAGRAIDVQQTPTWGAGFVLAEEHHELWGGLVDLDPNADAQTNAAHLAGQLYAGDGEDRVAFRDGDRYIARLIRHRRPEPAPLRSQRLLPDATYLITGGLGGIGLHVARWAVGAGARRLILLARTPLPPRREWAGLDPASVSAERVRGVRSLEAAGAAVHLATVDVADEGELRGWLDAFRTEAWPRVRGVFHCAGVIDDRLIVDMDLDSVRRVAAPKAEGAVNLARLLEDEPLDFLLLFASAGGLMGGIGQANYAAANAFLDGLAHTLRARGVPATSIDWGFWDGLGLATTTGGERVIAHMRKSGFLPLPPDRAVDVLDYVLGHEVGPQIAALRIDWRRFHTHAGTAGSNPLLDALAREEGSGYGAPAPARIRDELFTLEPGLPRRRRLQTFLRSCLADVLGLDAEHIETETPLGSLGIDSFTAIELRNRLERSLDIQLSATLAWNYPTLAAMAAYLAERMGFESGSAAGDMAQDGQEPDTELARILELADGLSEQELQQILEARTPDGREQDE